MQAALYVAVEDSPPANGRSPERATGRGDQRDGARCPSIDFWWIKPDASRRKRLNASTLSRNASGPHKNTPGASAAVYAPLAKLFTVEGGGSDEMRFSLEQCTAAACDAVPDACWRAVVRSSTEPELGGYLCLVWQEAWSSPLAYRKWIQGKLLYQKDPQVRRFHACPYRIDGKAVSVNLALEEEVMSVLPPDNFKLDCLC